MTIVLLFWSMKTTGGRLWVAQQTLVREVMEVRAQARAGEQKPGGWNAASIQDLGDIPEATQVGLDPGLGTETRVGNWCCGCTYRGRVKESSAPHIPPQANWAVPGWWKGWSAIRPNKNRRVFVTPTAHMSPVRQQVLSFHKLFVVPTVGQTTGWMLRTHQWPRWTESPALGCMIGTEVIDIEIIYV